MNGTVANVLIRAFNRDGQIEQLRAIIDTDASCSVIPAHTARIIGAPLDREAAWVNGVDGYDTALVELKLESPGCHWEPRSVVVSDEVAALTGPDAQMILGHDYLERMGARLTFGRGAPCPTCRPPGPLVVRRLVPGGFRYDIVS